MKVSTLARLMAAGAFVMTAALPASALNLPFGLGANSTERASPAVRPAEPPVRYAQAGDAMQRINQLEEDNRKLNGRVEELSFQLLQMQEQLRKIQEDNEFRFQELEGSTPAGGKRTEAAPAAPSAPAAPTETATARPAAPDAAADGDQIGDLLGGGLDTSGLGSGGLAGGTPAAPAAPPATGSSTIASVKPNGPSELYDLAYNYILAGDYQLAEGSFREYAQTYPDAGDTPDAEYWLGESLYQQGKYADAAETFLNAQKKSPKNAKAPEMMLKLGMSLAKLDNRDTACVTFKEVAKRYPQMSGNVKKKLDTESAAASC